MICRWLLVGKGADPKRKCQGRKAALDNKIQGDVFELTKTTNAKSGESLAICKPHSVGTKEGGQRNPNNKLNENFPGNTMAVSKKGKEKTTDGNRFHAKTRPLIKFHSLKGQTSRFLRQSVEFVKHEPFCGKSILRPGLPSFQSKIRAKVLLSHARQSIKRNTKKA